MINQLREETPASYIGIDPDCDKSGVASVRQGKIEFLETMTFFELYEYLRIAKVGLVVIEAGWLNRGNWHKTKGSNSVNAQIGQRTGANHQVGRKIVEMCEYLGLKYELIKPSRSKLDARTFERVTGYRKRTNPETRDAAMLVWGRK